MSCRSIVWETLLVLLVGTGPPLQAQPSADSTARDTGAVRVRLAPLFDSFAPSDRAAEQAAERLASLRRHPLNLNQASAAALSRIPYLSLAAAHRIVQYRSDHGPFNTIATLQSIEGITARTANTIRPFLTINPARSAVFPSFNTIVSNLELSLIQRYTRDLERGRGYKDGSFLGPPGRLTSRLRLGHERRLQLALTLDKDPGEPFRWAPATRTYGFDHVVGSLTLRNVGPVKTLILGDFSAQFGQGVALWQGIRFGKGRAPVSPVLQTGRGILPYRSASEVNFFRGVASTIGLPDNLSVTTFLSRRNRDASIDSSVAASGATRDRLPARTIGGGGQHRTPNERARKATFGETTIGGAVQYRSSSLHLGVTGYYARFHRPLRPGPKPYRRYRVSGHHTSTISAFGTAYLEKYTIFGEVARTPNGTYGGLLGSALDLGERFKAILLGRRYPPRLASFYGNAFAEGGEPQNELGVYTGLHVRIAERWALRGYFDQFRSPWLQFNVPRPTTGWEARLVLKHSPRPWLSTYLQVRTQRQAESTEYKGPGGRRLEGVQNEQRQSVRWHLEYDFSDALTLRSRLELSRHVTPSQRANGMYLSQGLRWTPFKTVEVNARLAFFDTEGFAARIYAYEHDLLYSFSVPVFFDEGRRSYLLVEYRPLPSLTVEAKYGITTYAHRTTIGSGLNQIQGSSRRELRLQVRWSL